MGTSLAGGSAGVSIVGGGCGESEVMGGSSIEGVGDGAGGQCGLEGDRLQCSVVVVGASGGWVTGNQHC